MKRLATVTINVPYKSAGNVIRQKEVVFEVYGKDEQFSIKPMLSEAERRLAGLPETLGFFIVDGKPFSSKGTNDGNFHIIQDVAGKLKEQNIIL
jgi:hypothetical protein